MNEEQKNRIYQVSLDFLRQQNQQKKQFRIHEKDDYSDLISHVKNALSDQEISIPDDEIGVAAAICVLGPRQNGEPSLAIIQRLVDVVQKEIPNDLARINEYAILYGLGKWRTLTSKSNNWNDVWQNAKLALMSIMTRFIYQVRNYLINKGIFCNHGARHFNKKNVLLNYDAGFIATALLNPFREFIIDCGKQLSISAHYQDIERRAVIAVPLSQEELDLLFPEDKMLLGEVLVLAVADGQGQLIKGDKCLDMAPQDTLKISITPWCVKIYRHRDKKRIELKNREQAVLSSSENISIRMQDWVFSSGAAGFITNHSVIEWDLRKYNLESWSALAVFGHPKTRSLRSHSLKGFSDSLYYSLLSSRCVGVCGSSRIEPFHMDDETRILRIVPFAIYLGFKTNLINGERQWIASWKKTCERWDGHNFDPTVHKWQLLENKLILFDKLISDFQPVYLEKCQACGNLFELEKNECPLNECSGKKSERPTTVWVYQPTNNQQENNFHDEPPDEPDGDGDNDNFEDNFDNDFDDEE